MNEYQVLIWHYSSKNERWYDATENVTWYQDGRNSWLVRFKGVKELRHVAYDKMHVFEKPKKVEFLELYYKDSPCFKVKALLCFNETIYKILVFNFILHINLLQYYLEKRLKTTLNLRQLF